MHFFVTGTDTGIGKTYISRLILQNWANQNLQTIGLKPIASGCEWIDGQYVNPDAHVLQQTATISLTYGEVNPYCFKLETSPHIAAEKQRATFTIHDITQHVQKVANRPHDRLLVEGAGGLMVPLNKTETQLDLLEALKLPVLFVIGLKLGCLNHTLLSMASLNARNIKIKGWMINHIDPNMICAAENIETLKHYLRHIPYLGHVPFGGHNVVSI